jgi:hypothetical protein
MIKSIGVHVEIFAFDPADHRDDFAERGWVHIQGGIDPDFLEYARKFIRQAEASRMESFALGQKQQSLFEFPDGVDFPDELYDKLSDLCGLQRDTMTLSERHVKAYDPGTVPEPEAHKDRYASQISIGLSIDIPEESTLILLPHDQPGVNRYNSAAAFRRYLQPGQQPAVGGTTKEVVIDDQPGDVIAFHGSRLWHFRRRAAGATNIYLKFNDFNSDPLGEDPYTARMRQATLAALSDDSDLTALRPTRGRRLDFVSRHYNREWDEVLEANLWGEEPFGLTQLQYDVLRVADGQRSTSELVRRLAGDAIEADDVRDAVRRLADVGAIDLLPAR